MLSVYRFLNDNLLSGEVPRGILNWKENMLVIVKVFYYFYFGYETVHVLLKFYIRYIVFLVVNLPFNIIFQSRNTSLML